MRTSRLLLAMLLFSAAPRASAVVITVTENYSVAAQAGTGELFSVSDANSVIANTYDVSGMHVTVNSHNYVSFDDFLYDKGDGPWAALSVEGASTGLSQPSAFFSVWDRAVFQFDTGVAIFANSEIHVRGYVAAGDTVRVSTGNEVGLLPVELNHALNWETTSPGLFELYETRSGLGGAQTLSIDSIYVLTVIRGIGVTERTWVEVVDPLLGTIQANSVTVVVPEPASFVLASFVLMGLVGAWSNRRVPRRSC